MKPTPAETLVGELGRGDFAAPSIRLLASEFNRRCLRLLSNDHRRLVSRPSGLLLEAVQRTTRHRALSVLSDPVVRYQINRLVTDRATGDACSEFAAVLMEARRFVREDKPGLPTLQGGAPLGNPESGPIVWEPDSSPPALRTRFLALFDEHIAAAASTPPAELVSGDAVAVATLRNGYTLLKNVAPYFHAVVVRHVNIVGLMEGSRDTSQSISCHAISSSVFLGPESLTSPLHTNDALFA